MQKKYDPMLLWAYLRRWADAQPEKPISPHVRVFIYVRDRAGAFYLHGPKLYWDENPNDGYFSNIDQGMLEDEAKNLDEVVVFGTKRNRMEDPVLFPSFEDFLSEIGFLSQEVGP